MATREDFLQAIAEEPDDDTHRLVFADWLDESGEPERAELLRIQCELARGVEDSGRFVALTKSARSLIDAHASRWLGPLYRSSRPPGFERGLAHVEFTAGQFLGKSFQKASHQWFPVAGVSGLTLCEKAKRAPDLCGEVLPARLSALKFTGTPVGDEGLSRLSRLTQLEHLNPNPVETRSFRFWACR
jgi:uncharacterized protein (TIGR02996 family)